MADEKGQRYHGNRCKKYEIWPLLLRHLNQQQFRQQNERNYQNVYKTATMSPSPTTRTTKPKTTIIRNINSTNIYVVITDIIINNTKVTITATKLRSTVIEAIKHTVISIVKFIIFIVVSFVFIIIICIVIIAVVVVNIFIIISSTTSITTSTTFEPTITTITTTTINVTRRLSWHTCTWKYTLITSVWR